MNYGIENVENMNDILTCPFCGKSPILSTSRRWPRNLEHAVIAYTVVCINMDCPIYNADGQYYLTEKEAVEAWNKRSN